MAVLPRRGNRPLTPEEERLVAESEAAFRAQSRHTPVRSKRAKETYEDVAANNISKHSRRQLERRNRHAGYTGRGIPIGPGEEGHMADHEDMDAESRRTGRLRGTRPIGPGEPGEHVHQEPDTESKIAAEEAEWDRKRLAGVQTVERPDGTFESINVEDTRPTDAPPVSERIRPEDEGGGLFDRATGERIRPGDEGWFDAVNQLLRQEVLALADRGYATRLLFSTGNPDNYRLDHEDVDELRGIVQQKYGDHPEVLRALNIRLGTYAAQLEREALGDE